MQNSYLAKVSKIHWDGKSNFVSYYLQYENSGVPHEVVSKESVGSVFEVGDEVKITVDNGTVIKTNIRSATRARSAIMIGIGAGLLAIALLLFIFI